MSAAPPRVGALRTVLLAFALAISGAVAGFAYGIATPAHTEIAGAQADVQVHFGRAHDELDLSGVLIGKRSTDRAVLGEAVGVSVRLGLDAATFTTADGSFNTDVLPAYINAYSDPRQLARDLRWAVLKHLLWCTAAGAVIALLVGGCGVGYRGWRRRRDAQDPCAARARHTAIAYRAPERRLAVIAVVAAAVVVTLGTVPGSGRAPDTTTRITPNPIFDGTPLAGTQVSGVLRPLIEAAQSYIRTYFADTNAYYDQLQKNLEQALDAGELRLPTSDDGSDLVNIGFVTDRHCNIGMDRVIVALLEHFAITTLVSAGDDDFSGSFPFEAACTRNLAAKSQQAGITDVFVAGNHDSALTLTAERREEIKVLDGTLVTADGLTFAGYPDPRRSRYGTGIEPPSATERDRLIAEQGKQTGALACRANRPVIVVLHDPSAGRDALGGGCGKAVLALDGHTHRQVGPTALTLVDGTTGYQFVGASTGGAPGEESIERTFASQLTVGPLNHDATVNIVTIDRSNGALVAVTVCRFKPAQDIDFSTLTPTG